MSLEPEQQEITQVSLHKYADQAVLENKQTGRPKGPASIEISMLVARYDEVC